MFDANGDLVTKFDIFQGQKTPAGVFHLVHVGMIDPQVSSGNKMMVQLKEDLQVSSLNAEKTVVLVFQSLWEISSPGFLLSTYA
jgi:vomeronasal 2 receptor